MFGLIHLLELTKRGVHASGMCNNGGCGSIGLSSNYPGDMNNLMSTGSNCMHSPNYPLTQPGYQQEMCQPNYFGPQTQTGFYPGQENFPSTLPPMYPGQGGNDEGCDIVTSVECGKGKQRPAPYNQFYPSGGNQRPGQGGNGQTCDCSQMGGNGGMFGGGGMLGGGCDCGQMGGMSSQLIGQPSTYPPMYPQNSYPGQASPAFCQSGSGGMLGPNGRPSIGNKIIDAFDCRKPTYPPIRTAVIGSMEMPIADNFVAQASTCGNNAPCTVNN